MRRNRSDRGINLLQDRRYPEEGDGLVHKTLNKLSFGALDALGERRARKKVKESGYRLYRQKLENKIKNLLREKKGYEGESQDLFVDLWDELGNTREERFDGLVKLLEGHFLKRWDTESMDDESSRKFSFPKDARRAVLEIFDTFEHAFAQEGEEVREKGDSQDALDRMREKTEKRQSEMSTWTKKVWDKVDTNVIEPWRKMGWKKKMIYSFALTTGSSVAFGGGVAMGILFGLKGLGSLGLYKGVKEYLYKSEEKNLEERNAIERFFAELTERDEFKKQVIAWGAVIANLVFGEAIGGLVQLTGHGNGGLFTRVIEKVFYDSDIQNTSDVTKLFEGLDSEDLGEPTPTPSYESGEEMIQKITKGSNVWDTAKKFGLSKNEFARAWTNSKIEIDGKEVPIHEVGLVHEGDEVVYVPPAESGGIGHFEVREASGLDIGTDEDLAEVYRAKGKELPDFLKKSLGVEIEENTTNTEFSTSEGDRVDLAPTESTGGEFKVVVEEHEPPPEVEPYEEPLPKEDIPPSVDTRDTSVRLETDTPPDIEEARQKLEDALGLGEDTENTEVGIFRSEELNDTLDFLGVSDDFEKGLLVRMDKMKISEKGAKEVFSILTRGDLKAEEKLDTFAQFVFDDMPKDDAVSRYREWLNSIDPIGYMYAANSHPEHPEYGRRFNFIGRVIEDLVRDLRGEGGVSNKTILRDNVIGNLKTLYPENK